MSSSVFVLDAQGTPLMPMAAAHARTLLARGRAHWVPHHSFSILQLTSTVIEPILHPIIVGVSISPRIAELFLVSTSLRGVRLLLTVAVDVRHSMYRSPSLDVLSQRFQGRIRHPLRLGQECGEEHALRRITLNHHAIVIVQTIIAFQQFLPVSHIALLPSRAVQAPFLLRYHKQFSQYVLPHLIERGLRLVVPPDTVTVATDDMPDISMVSTNLMALYRSPTARLSCLVAVPSFHTLPSVPTTVSGMAASALIDGRWAKGIIISQVGRFARQSMLRVPIAMRPTGIVWRSYQLSSATRLYYEPTSAIMFLPLFRHPSRTEHHGEE